MTFSEPPVNVRTMRERNTAAMMRIPTQAKNRFIEKSFRVSFFVNNSKDSPVLDGRRKDCRPEINRGQYCSDGAESVKVLTLDETILYSV